MGTKLTNLRDEHSQLLADELRVERFRAPSQVEDLERGAQLALGGVGQPERGQQRGGVLRTVPAILGPWEG